LSTVLSVRLDRETEGLLGRLAKKKGRRKSDVVREALIALADRESLATEPDRPYQALAHLIGTVRGDRSDLSARTGEAFRRLLAGRRR